MIIFTIDRNSEITPQTACKYIRIHRQRNNLRYDMLKRYYDGNHDILYRRKEKYLSNNRIVSNHAKYITDTLTGYVAGNPVTYTSKSDISLLTDMLKKAESDIQDTDLAHNISIYGRGYEMAYMSSDEIPYIKLENCNPCNAFVVYDDTVEHKPVFSVYYFAVYDDNQNLKGYKCTMSTHSLLYEFSLGIGFDIQGEIVENENIFGMVNIIEYYNNAECQGDFEQVISLIDAYNKLQSDRLNDKEQFVDAILLIKGQILGDSTEEESEAYSNLRKFGLLMLDSDSSAEWLTRSFDENSVEILKKSLENDIHKFSGVPCLTDENFAGNASGVAMKYKLIGLENIAKVKERYFKEGLYYRLKLFANIIRIKGGGDVNIDEIDIKFTRSLPQNELEIAQTIATLQGTISNQTLISLLPFVTDAKAEIELLKSENQETEDYGNINPPALNEYE